MKKFQKHKGFYIFGRNAVEEAFAKKPEKIQEIFWVREKDKNAAGLEDLVLKAREQGILSTVVDRKKAESLIGEKMLHQGVIAYYTGFEYTALDSLKEDLTESEEGCILVIDKIEDVQNLGAIIRTAAAVDVRAVIVPQHEQAPVNGTVFKTSAGQVEKVTIIQVTSIPQALINLKDWGFWVYGVDMEDPDQEYPSGNVWDQKYDRKSAIVVGSEGKGISLKAREKCDFFAPIPMENNVESLNVSVAAAIVMYEWKRQLRS